MFKKFTYAVSISALAALSLASVASANTQYASFDIANGDSNEEITRTVSAPQQVLLNVGHGDDSDMPAAVLDYSNFTIANGDANEEVGGSSDSKVQAVVTVQQPTKLNIGHGDDNDGAGRSVVAPKLNIGASDPAEQA